MAPLAEGALGKARLSASNNPFLSDSHMAAYNLNLIPHALLGAGTPRELAARGGVLVW